jgi:D-aminoacyl-tRNA deacylase
VRLVVQRVTRAAVRIAGQEVGAIERGAVVLVGIAVDDTSSIVGQMADKLADLRYFEDPLGRTNLAIDDVAGSLLVISQFTLLADVRRGRRPSFTRAAAPEVAKPLLDQFVGRVRARGIRVETGRFGAEMEVDLVNDGPFTLVLDSERHVAST